MDKADTTGADTMSKFIPEEYVGEKPIEISQHEKLFYVKFVGIGPETLAQKNNMVCEIVKEQKGFFLVGPAEEIRKKLHDTIESMCDAAKLP